MDPEMAEKGGGSYFKKGNKGDIWKHLIYTKKGRKG